MIITGLEVIRGNPEANSPALIIEALPGEKVELTYGDSLRVNVSLNYKGPRLDATLYGAIGVRGVGFEEKVHGESDASFIKSDFFTPWSGSVEIPISADIKPSTNYDIYCKIDEYPAAGAPEIDNVVDIVGIPPTFELLEETIYPYAYVYDGDAEITTFTFKTDPFTPASWIAGRFADYFENEARKSGLRVMEMRVYVDKSPLLWADWRIEVVGTPSPTTVGVGMSLGIPLWVAVLIIAFAIIAVIIVATLATKTIVGLFKHKPIDEEIKKAMSRKSLLDLIGDFEVKLIDEEKLPGPPTPITELEKLNDQALRDYADELAEMIVPPPVPIPPLAIAAIAVLGLGGLVIGAFALRGRE